MQELIGGNEMYRLQIWKYRTWIWGIVDYDSLEKAENRVKQLEKVRIKARVKKSEELFS